MKKHILFIFFALLSFSLVGQVNKVTALTSAINQFSEALINADSVSLRNLISPSLNYGHSNGMLENGDVFIKRLISGKSDFISIQITNQSIVKKGKLAIVRHQFDAITNDDGKPGQANLLVLTIWERKNKKWILIERQSVRRI